jgi:hypothetical protein
MAGERRFATRTKAKETIVVLYFASDDLIGTQMFELYHRSLDTSSHLDSSSHLSDDVQKCATVDHMSDISSIGASLFRTKNQGTYDARRLDSLYLSLFLSTMAIARQRRMLD